VPKIYVVLLKHVEANLVTCLFAAELLPEISSPCCFSYDYCDRNRRNRVAVVVLVWQVLEYGCAMLNNRTVD